MVSGIILCVTAAKTKHSLIFLKLSDSTLLCLHRSATILKPAHPRWLYPHLSSIYLLMLRKENLKKLWASTIPQHAISQRTLFDTIEISRTAPIIHLTVRVFCQLLLVRSRLSFWSQIQAVCIKCNCEICHSFCYRFTTDSNKRLLIRSLKPLKFYLLSCTFGFSFLFILQSHA